MLKRRIIVTALLLAAILALVWLFESRREPSYFGHPISYWIEPWHHHETESPEREAAAFAEMDERAVRWLARQLAWRPSRLKEGFARIMNSIVGDFMADRDYDNGRRGAALQALTRLGDRARPAIPEIEAVSQTTVELHKESIRGQALGALIRIRGESLSPYLERLASAQGEDWRVLITALAAQGTNSAAAVPFLVDALHRTNSNVWRAPTLAALGSIRSHPELSVPTLARYLTMTNQIERQVTLAALAKFGPDAKLAWTNLVACLSNSDNYTSLQVKRVLRQIDPEAAAKLGIGDF